MNIVVVIAKVLVLSVSKSHAFIDYEIKREKTIVASGWRYLSALCTGLSAKT